MIKYLMLAILFSGHAQAVALRNVSAGSIRTQSGPMFPVLSPEPLWSIEFGSGLTQSNPSQHHALSICEPVAGTRFLAVGDQDTIGRYGYVRKGCVHVFTSVSGGPWTYHQRLESPLTGRSSQWMGHSVEAGGPWIMSGNTHSYQNAGTGEGEVEVFKYNSATGLFDWHSVLQAADAGSGDEFGMLISLDATNGWLAVGSPQLHDFPDTSTSGKMYFYQLIGNVWTEQQQFIEPGNEVTPGIDNAFSSALVRSGHAFANSFGPLPGPSGGNYYKGIIYHYLRTGGVWEYNETLVPSPHDAGHRFGASIAFDGQRLISFDWGIKNFRDGGFTVLRWDDGTWTQEYSYTDTGNPLIPFNKSHRWGHKGLFIAGNTIVAPERFADGDWTGIPDMDGPPTSKGIAYVFKRIGSTWYKSHILAPSTRQQGDWFGDLLCWDALRSELLVVSTGAYRSATKTMILQGFTL